MDERIVKQKIAKLLYKFTARLDKEDRSRVARGYKPHSEYMRYPMISKSDDIPVAWATDGRVVMIAKQVYCDNADDLIGKRCRIKMNGTPLLVDERVPYLYGVTSREFKQYWTLRPEDFTPLMDCVILAGKNDKQPDGSVDSYAAVLFGWNSEGLTFCPRVAGQSTNEPVAWMRARGGNPVFMLQADYVKLILQTERAYGDPVPMRVCLDSDLRNSHIVTTAYFYGGYFDYYVASLAFTLEIWP